MKVSRIKKNKYSALTVFSYMYMHVTALKMIEVIHFNNYSLIFISFLESILLRKNIYIIPQNSKNQQEQLLIHFT